MATLGAMAPTDPRTILLAAPRGFCAGVDRAIEIVEIALERLSEPVYVRHAIVHNTHVVADLEAKGAIFVEDEAEVPEGGAVVFSAHGIPPEVRTRSAERGLNQIDATCPLVTKVHYEALEYAHKGYSIILIGHEGHQEVIGTMGQAPESINLVEVPEDVWALDLPDPDKVAYISQTTLSVDETQGVIAAIRERYPNAKGPKGDDICYATQNRQDATKVLADRSDLVLVVGSTHSSNSQRMVEVALAAGARASYLIDDASQIDPAWLDGVDTIGLTSGASAPEVLVDGVIERLQGMDRGAVVEHLEVIDEQMHFALPAKVRNLPLLGAASGDTVLGAR
jgi:4-hydroxy-3-methylbut-2-en-1-yl diphosphate reductase